MRQGSSGNRLAVAALVVGIIALVGCAVCFIGLLCLDSETARSSTARSEDFDTLLRLIRILESKVDQYSSVSLDPSNPHGYTRVNSSSGFFLVSLEHIEPYLNGVRVRLNIGNPLSATYNGFTVKAKWGPRGDPAKMDFNYYREWRSSFQEKQVSFADALEPGCWNEVELVLSPAAPDRFGDLEISIETAAVSLHRNAGL